MRGRLRAALILLAFSAARASAEAASGTQGASFLDIPVGGRPASMGGAYSALASDAYAPVYDPGGLAFLPATQFSGMHLDFAGVGGYEFVSAVRPLGARDGIGASAQYFHTGASAALDVNGNSAGTVSSHYGAYSIAYGHAFTDRFSLGAAAKIVEASLADVSARAFAGDVGAVYRIDGGLSFAAAASNLGGRLEFLREADGIPENYRAGAAYSPLPELTVSAEGASDRAGLLSGRFGAEWRPVRALALRAGYRTETTTQLSALAGVTAGFGLEIFGQRFDYAWIPLGELGQNQYFSVVFTFGAKRG